MVRIARAILAALMAGVCALPTAAQAALSVPEGLVSGGAVAIGYYDPSRAGQAVTIEINDGGFPKRQSVSVIVQLDSEGRGNVQWQVPGWGWASFNAPGVDEQSRLILQ